MIWSCPIIRDEEEDRGGFLVDLRVVLTLVWWWTAAQQQTARGPWLTLCQQVTPFCFLLAICNKLLAVSEANHPEAWP